MSLHAQPLVQPPLCFFSTFSRLTPANRPLFVFGFVGPAAARIMRETHAPDAVSLKTAHSGVKFEILISKNPIQFHRARNQPTNQPTRVPACFPPLAPLRVGRLLFLALFLSRPRSRRRGVTTRAGCSKASNVSINAAAGSRTSRSRSRSFFARALIALCDFTATKTPGYLRIAAASLAPLRKKIRRFQYPLRSRGFEIVRRKREDNLCDPTNYRTVSLL